jgi:hypothetical protein
MPSKASDEIRRGATLEEIGSHTVTVSFPIPMERRATVSAEQLLPIESLATVTSLLVSAVDAIGADLQQLTAYFDPLAVDTATLLKGATVAADLLRRELASERPRFDVIRLCAYVIKWLATKGDIFVTAVLASARGQIGMELANKLLQTDLPTAMAQLEHWMQIHNIPL